MLNARAVLVVAAHADDEVLGAGATLARLASRGARVHVLVLSSSVRSRGLPADEAERVRCQRRDDAGRAARALGASVEVHDFPDNGFDTVPGVALNACVEAAVRAHRPDLVFTHWAHDLSADHRAAAGATLVACRPGGPAGAATLLAYEVRSSTDWAPAPVRVPFAPTLFVSVDEAAWACKCQALAHYGDELRSAPHARSLEGLDALARYRGTQVSAARAEAFALLRAVVSP